MYDNNLSIVFRITLFELAAEAITTKNKKTSQTQQSERFLFIYSKENYPAITALEITIF